MAHQREQQQRVRAPTCHRWPKASPCCIEVPRGLSWISKSSHKTGLNALLTLGGIFGVRALNDGVDGARLLTETAVDALGHVNVVSRCPSGAVLALLGFNGDGLCWANGLAQLAGNASLLSGWVPFGTTSARSFISPRCPIFFKVLTFSKRALL